MKSHSVIGTLLHPYSLFALAMAAIVHDAEFSAAAKGADKLGADMGAAELRLTALSDSVDRFMSMVEKYGADVPVPYEILAADAASLGMDTARVSRVCRADAEAEVRSCQDKKRMDSFDEFICNQVYGNMRDTAALRKMIDNSAVECASYEMLEYIHGKAARLGASQTQAKDNLAKLIRDASFRDARSRQRIEAARQNVHANTNRRISPDGKRL